MNYGNSILPTEGAYYTFKDAYISNGIMHIEAGGYAKFEITKAVISSLTDYFRVSFLLDEPVDRYMPTLYMYLDATMASGKQLHYSIAPTSDAGEVFTEEIALQAGDYLRFECTIYSSTTVTLQLYELCPEAADVSAEIEIAGVKQSLPKLLYDYNTLPLQVDYEESVIGMITFNLLNSTDLQGHLEVSYVASEDCVLTIRIKDTGVTELYTPIEYDIKAGRGNIALPHAYLSRLTGLHSTYVTAQVSKGTFAIVTRGLLYTIDGGYLASREADLGVTVFDLSIQQLEGSEKPDEIWLACVDINELFVKSRAYADAYTSFTPRYSLGAAKTAAIEFNGSFMPDPAMKLNSINLYTEDRPYVFWTDMEDTLWCQKGEDESTKYQLDTEVSMVSACRGYKSLYRPEQDQGLVVLYVKNGQALYKSYSYESDDMYAWQGPFVIPCDEPVISAYVHRLNDYRLGICLTTASNNYWYITERTYVTQASPIEQIEIGFEHANPIIAVFTPDFTYEPIVVTAATNDTNEAIILEFSYPIAYTRDILARDFETISGRGKITGVSYVDDRHILLKLSEKNYFGITIKYLSTDNSLRYMPLEDRHVIMPNFTVVCPGYNYKDTIEVSYGSADAKVSITGKTTLEHSASDTLNIAYASSSGSVQMLPIITSKYAQPADTLSVTYSATEGSVEIQKTGTSPI